MRSSGSSLLLLLLRVALVTTCLEARAQRFPLKRESPPCLKRRSPVFDERLRALVGAPWGRQRARGRAPGRLDDAVTRERLALSTGRARAAPRGQGAGGGLRRARRHAHDRPW